MRKRARLVFGTLALGVAGTAGAGLMAVFGLSPAPAAITPQAGDPCDVPNSFLISGNTTTQQPDHYLICDGGYWMVLKAARPGGNIGVGTTMPPYKFTIVGQLDGSPYALFGINNTADGAASYNEIAFGDHHLYYLGSGNPHETATGVPDAFFLWDAVAHRYRWAVLPNGFFGVGTTQPQATFDVAGYMRLALNKAAPAACRAANDGSIALTHQHTACVCNPDKGWVKLQDGQTMCPW